MGKTYKSDRDDYEDSYLSFAKKKNKSNKIKNFLDTKKGAGSKYEYLDKNQKSIPTEE